jgi:hypothetical protein
LRREHFYLKKPFDTLTMAVLGIFATMKFDATKKALKMNLSLEKYRKLLKD